VYIEHVRKKFTEVSIERDVLKISERLSLRSLAYETG
jgi:hypothetical protein